MYSTIYTQSTFINARRYMHTYIKTYRHKSRDAKVHICKNSKVYIANTFIFRTSIFKYIFFASFTESIFLRGKNIEIFNAERMYLKEKKRKEGRKK